MSNLARSSNVVSLKSARRKLKSKEQKIQTSAHKIGYVNIFFKKCAEIIRKVKLKFKRLKN